MADITRDDLRVPLETDWGLRKPTDEEFDRLAREQGYIRPTEGRYNVMDWLQEVAGPDRAEALRALLTDECELCDGLGHPQRTNPCPDCGGRGWLPKDGVTIHRNASTGYETAMFPVDWLEAEDE